MPGGEVRFLHFIIMVHTKYSFCSTSKSGSLYFACLQHHTYLTTEGIFSRQDEGVNVPAPALLLYTPGMPCMVLSNINSALGLVNGTRGTASWVIPEPEYLFFEDLLLSSIIAD
jgi:hypothetical protein